MAVQLERLTLDVGRYRRIFACGPAQYPGAALREQQQRCRRVDDRAFFFMFVIIRCGLQPAAPDA